MYLIIREVHLATNQWDLVEACNLCAPGATRDVPPPLAHPAPSFKPSHV